MEKLGIVISEKYWKKKCWLSVCTNYLYDYLAKSFDSVMIHSQSDYNKHKDSLKAVFGGNAFGGPVPKIKYDTSMPHKTCYLLSDPHDDQKEWYLDYIESNDIDFVFAFYYHPTKYHYPDMPENKLVHFPWSIPDEFIADYPVDNRSTDLMIFGGMGAEAYSCRRWCSNQWRVSTESNSCRNKAVGDAGYFKWLGKHDAVIGAGSLDKQYQLVFPKYFEIVASGCLLFAQRCKDLERLGFNDKNCVIFDRKNFKQKVDWWLRNPAASMKIRRAGLELIRDRHALSVRMRQVSELLECQLKQAN